MVLLFVVVVVDGVVMCLLKGIWIGFWVLFMLVLGVGFMLLLYY